MSLSPADDVDALTAALRADAADLDVYARVLTTSLAAALPPEMVGIDRDRSFTDWLNKRAGRVRGIRILLGDWELTLSPGDSGLPVAQAKQKVRGVAISSREVTLDEWARLLANGLAKRARDSAEARAALARLLGQA
ncbi:MAG: hypothetical protein QOC82_66 [Frankiaceae bacterium]|jgi:hypothetical protein|nr:hypothetical protein [Frankiaceae bacterium]MDQ1698298.1 hypothetical protein [Frankiaceae bacterium]